VWGLDSEFPSNAKPTDPVHSIQLWNAVTGENHFFRNKEELHLWFRTVQPKTVYVWVSEAEFGSLKAWELIGVDPYDKRLETINRFKIEWAGKLGGKHRTLCMDIAPFYKQAQYKHKFLRTLKSVGEFLSDFYHRDLHKLDAPLDKESFGLRAPKTESEWEQFKKYSLKDAEITAMAAYWLQTEILDKYTPNQSLNKMWSWGTIAKCYFKFTEIGVKMGNQTFVPALHELIRKNTFAGRSEAFMTGYIGKTFYLDIASLYPCVTSWTNALEIVDAEPLTNDEIRRIQNGVGFQEATGQPYGWLRGDWRSSNDLWGLPARGASRNYYVTGVIKNTLCSTFDLEAAKCEPLSIMSGLKPVFKDNPEQQKYIDLTFKKLEGKYETEPEKHAIKGVLNSATGKLGASHPVSVFSNFPAYSIIVSAGHAIMSRCFDQSPKPIAYTDTDSFFTLTPFSKTMFTLHNEKYKVAVPITAEQKAEGDNTVIFRSKNYWQNPDSYAYHGWQAYANDWRRIIETLPEGTAVQYQIKRTYRTRNKKALHLQIGRWQTDSRKYDVQKLAELFSGDNKRKRDSTDSYKLAQRHASLQSRSWTIDELEQLTLNELKESWLLKFQMDDAQPNLTRNGDVQRYIQKMHTPPAS
jgi:hypothetical protein